jgi:hypothetical protein
MPRLERVTKEMHPAVQHDFNNMMLGELLGTGCSREVYVDRMCPSRVVKIEEEGHQNVTEFLTWGAVCDTHWNVWFARVWGISANGRILTMERARLPKKRPPMPELVPSFMADARECNMGIVKGRWVFCDYGYTNLLRCGLNNFTWVPRTEDGVFYQSMIKVPLQEWELP